MTVVVLLLLACTADKPAPADDSVAPDTDTTDTDPVTDTDTSPPDPDADDDGYDAPAYGGDDCDDTDPDVHPGAEEVPGNGVDDDCAGGDLPDADGDGHGDAAAGGDDCDDTSAWVYPGAVEYCDPVDQDCDGVAIAPGGCEGAQAPEAWATWLFEESGTGGSYLVDQDGDGLQELVAGGGLSVFPYNGDDVGPAWAVYHGVPDPTPVTPADRAQQVVTAVGDGEGIDAGDVTGDGLPDVVVIGLFSYVAWIRSGPLPMDGTLIDLSESDIFWSGSPVSDDGWCVTPVLGGDFDADGTDDLLCPNGAKSGDEGEIEFFRGGEFGPNHGSALAEPTPRLQLLPDLTGDGANELFAEASSYTAVLDGADIAAGVDVSDADIASMGYERITLHGTADRTGDGIDDLLLGDSDADFLGYPHGAVYFLDGATARGELSPDATALGSWVGLESGLHIWTGVPVDLDGDGNEEVACFGGDTLGEIIVTPVAIPTRGEPVTQWGLTLANAMFRPDLLEFGNVDTLGSGEDLLFFRAKDVPYAFDTYLYPGWDIPWFDRTYWPNAE